MIIHEVNRVYPSLRALILGVSTLLVAALPAPGQTQFVTTSTGPGTFFNSTVDEMSLADIDGDDDVDIVVVAGLPSIALINDGHGRFSINLAQIPTLPISALTMGDVDGDRDVDLVINYALGPTRLAVYLNDGRGSFTSASDMATAQLGSGLLSLFDADLDGDLDLVASGGLLNNGIFINHGAGVFRDETASRLVSPLGTCRPADIDGDGKTDLLNAYAGSLEVLQNDGVGRFALTQTVAVPRFGRWTLAVPADVDNDGDIDVLVISWGKSALLINDGRGQLAHEPHRLPAQISLSHKAVFGDIDEDGDLDLMIANGLSSVPAFTPWAYMNDGQGKFTDASRSRLGTLPTGCVAVGMADFDGDRDLDLVFGRDTGGAMLIATNRLRHVDAASSVRIGTTWPVQLWARAGFASAPQLAFPFGSTQLAAVPLRLPYGSVFLGAGLISFPAVVVPPPSGSFGAQLSVPNVAYLIGQTAYVQAMILHDTMTFGLTPLGVGRIVP